MKVVTPNVMGVTWLTATTQDRGDIPLEPLLYIGLDYDSPLAEAIVALPQYIRLIWPGGRYQVLDAHTQQAVFTRDAPVDPESHDTFRRLTHHWGWWFMRLTWMDRNRQMFYSDFQVMQVGGKVFPLQASIETALNDLNLSRTELHRHLTAALQHPPDDQRDAVAQEQIEKYEALVGPLPAHLTVLSSPPGTQVKVDRRKFLDGALSQADVVDAMWATQGKPRFEKVTVKPRDVKSKNDNRLKRPCERCGKTGPRYHYSVKVGSGTHNVCMDCADELGASEMFKEKPAAPKKSNHDWVIGNYLTLLEGAQLNAALSEDVYRQRNPRSNTTLQDMRRSYALLRDARIYELTVADLTEHLLPAAQAYLATCTGFDPTDYPVLREAARSLTAQVPMPGPLPFPVIYVGWGEGGALLDDEGRVKFEGSDRLVGTLLAESGEIIDYCLTESPAGKIGEKFATLYLRKSIQGWTTHQDDNTGLTGNDYCDTPWIFTLLIAALNDKQTIVLRQEKTPLRERLQFEKASKKARQRFLPRPYYTVTIQEQLVQDHARKLPRLVIPREWSHRFDRDAHYRHYVRRGPLPLGDRKRRDLTEAGFDIFTDPSQVTGEAMAILMRRGVPQMKADEWLATKKTHVDAQLQIPHNRLDLPYVPAVRKPEGPLIPDPSKSG
jgi:hypothetical protein